MPKSLAAKMHTIDIYIHTNQTSYVQGRPIVQCCCKRYKCVANSNTPKCPSLDTLCAFEFNGMITCKFALAFLGALCVFRSRQVLSPSCVSRSAQLKICSLLGALCVFRFSSLRWKTACRHTPGSAESLVQNICTSQEFKSCMYKVHMFGSPMRIWFNTWYWMT